MTDVNHFYHDLVAGRRSLAENQYVFSRSPGKLGPIG
jgi:hypothetical protein